MLKSLLAATTALTLMSGVGFADSIYTHSKTELTVGIGGSRDIDMHKSVRANDNGMVTERDRTMKNHADGDDAHVTLSFGREHDRDVDHKDKTISKSTEVSPTGEVTRNKTESTTIR